MPAPFLLHRPPPQVSRFQAELDKLSGTLKQIEAYNEQMKNEIAVTRRATYVAEESVTKMEKEKKDQDLLIDMLQEQMKQQHQQLSLYEAQLEAQRRETRAAQETLVEAEREMDAINFEKKQLAAQWKSALIGIARRDEALQATEDAVRRQREQEMAIESEIEGYKRSIKGEQQENERLTGVTSKLEAEQSFLHGQQNTLKDKLARLQEVYSRLKKSLETTDASLTASTAEAKQSDDQLALLDKAVVKAGRETADLEAAIYEKLSEQTTVEKAGQKEKALAGSLRRQIFEQEMVSAQVQNELAKIRVDMLNTESHNDTLRSTLKVLNEELDGRVTTIEKYEAEIKQRHDEIEKKTKEVDKLNRQFEKLTANMTDEETGPLEATIANLKREILAKEGEGREMQRMWVAYQTDLVGLINDNNALAEKIQRLKSETTVLTQKRGRLDRQQSQQDGEIKELEISMVTMRQDMSRLHALIAKNADLQALLANDNFVLEGSIVSNLRELEEEAGKIEARIQEVGEDKRLVLAEIVEAERQIMLWERKIQLEKETQSALDPEFGGAILAAMKKEIHRMKLRYAELLRRQEKLIQDMEGAIAKRDLIATKGRTTVAAGAKKAADLTEMALNKAIADLKRSIRETEKEASMSDARVAELDSERVSVTAELEQATARLRTVAEEDSALRAAVSSASNARFTGLVSTANAQRMARRYEELAAGTYRPTFDEGSVAHETSRAAGKRSAIANFVERVANEVPRLAAPLERVQAILSAS